MGRVVNPYRDQLAQALAALEVTSRDTYSWFGRRSRPLARGMAAAIGPDATRAYLVDAIARELYASFYCAGVPVLREAGERELAYADEPFVEALSAANRGRGGWQAGWHVAVVERDDLVVERDGLRVRAARGDCAPAARSRAVGDPVSVRRAKEQRHVSPGFYAALGDAPWRGRADGAPGLARAPAPRSATGTLGADDVELRVYVNVAPAGAAALVALLTGALNERAVPYALKVLNRPASFWRCDAAVLYLEVDDFDRARDTLREAALRCAPHLRDRVPAFTKRLARGIAAGEQRTSAGVSFGSARSRLVAEGVLDARDRRMRSAAAQLAAVEARFEADGLRLDVPYLASSTADRYEL